jgi:1-deoxy-D-xylulose-5-phosphate reductoisomerase
MIGFLDICAIVAEVLDEHCRTGVSAADIGSTLVPSERLDVDTVLAADRWARRRAGERAGSRQQAVTHVAGMEKSH